MKNIVFNADYFIDKFSKIDSRRWTVGSFEKHGRYCALGHCGANQSNRATTESLALCRLFRTYINMMPNAVNDNNWYAQGIYGHIRGARARVLAALNDIKKKGG